MKENESKQVYATCIGVKSRDKKKVERGKECVQGDRRLS